MGDTWILIAFLLIVGKAIRATRANHMNISLKYNYFLLGPISIKLSTQICPTAQRTDMQQQLKGTVQKTINEVKVQYPQPKRRPRSDKFLRRKTQCPLHTNQRLLYRCAQEGCRQPYFCPEVKCIQLHFHQNMLKTTKIDVSAFEDKFERAQQAVSNSQRFFSEAFQIKAVVDSLKNSVTNLFRDVNGMGKVYGELKADVDTVLTCAYINKIQEALKIESRITASIEKIRAKINLVPQEKVPTGQGQKGTEGKGQGRGLVEVEVEQAQENSPVDFLMRNEISNFLQANIGTYDERTMTTIIDIKLDQKQYDFTQFHKTLSGKENLIFIFASQNTVTGSYFSHPYPSNQGTIKDASSFIFTARQEGEQLKILKYLANEDSKCHLQVCQGMLIAQGYLHTENKGVRIVDGSWGTLEVTLPSESFAAENPSEEGVFESVKLEQILVMQVKSEPVRQ